MAGTSKMATCTTPATTVGIGPLPRTLTRATLTSSTSIAALTRPITPTATVVCLSAVSRYSNPNIARSRQSLDIQPSLRYNKSIFEDFSRPLVQARGNLFIQTNKTILNSFQITFVKSPHTSIAQTIRSVVLLYHSSFSHPITFQSKLPTTSMMFLAISYDDYFHPYIILL